MAADDTNGKPKIEHEGKSLSIKKARAVMEELTEEAASLQADESNAAKARRVEIARSLRAIQAKIDTFDEMVTVTIPPNDPKRPWCPFFPIRIGPKEFWPGTHTVRGPVAQTLHYMMERIRETEGQRLISGGNAHADSLGEEIFIK